MKKKKQPVPVLPVAHVDIRYVQYGFPDSAVDAIIEALSQALLSEYYSQFCDQKRGDEDL